MKKKIVSTALVFVLLFALVPVTTTVSAMGDTFATISAGSTHSLALKSDGSLWAWGWGAIWYDINQSIPVKIMDDVISVSAGNCYSLALKSDGSLWGWGGNSYGQLGYGTPTTTSTPVKIMDDVISVSAGDSHCMAIKSDGSLWAWGDNSYGQLGNGTRITTSIPVKIMDDVTTISAGSDYSLAVKSDGSLWAWGTNLDESLGYDNTDYYASTPVKIMDDVATISAEGIYNLAVKSDGSLWAWGDNNRGQIGDGSTAWKSKYPVKIMDDVTAISAGGTHSFAIKSDGSLWAWGYNYYGELGDGTIGGISEYSSTPVKIMDDVISVNAGGRHSMAIKSDGSLWTWGYNHDGELGDGTTTIVNPNNNAVIEDNDKSTPEKIMDDVMLPITGNQTGTAKNIIVTFGATRYILNGAPFAQDTMVYNGVAYLPAAYLATKLGLTAVWDAATNTTTLTSTGVMSPAISEISTVPTSSPVKKVISATFGATKYILNGVPFDQATMVYDGVAYLPAAYLATKLGLTAFWDAATNITTLTSK